MTNSKKYFNYKRRMKYFLLVLLYMVARTHAQYELNDASMGDDDLTFAYQDKSLLDDALETTTLRAHHAGPHPNRRQKMKTRTSPTTHIKTSTPMQAASSTASKLETTTKITSPHSAGSTISAPYTYSPEKLNQSHADIFANWLDQKSDELYELSMNFSGYKLLNETYSVKLRGDAGFAWINFTEMIVNISQTISEVLYNKTVIVKNLTDLVEKAFDDFRNQPSRYEESAKFVYYDSKSPKTFCDVQERLNIVKPTVDTSTTSRTTSSSSSSSSSTSSMTTKDELIHEANLNGSVKLTTKKQRKSTSPKAVQKRDFEAAESARQTYRVMTPNQCNSNLANAFPKNSFWKFLLEIKKEFCEFFFILTKG